MPICPGKAASKKLERFNTSWDDHMKRPVVDITLPLSFSDNSTEDNDENQSQHDDDNDSGSSISSSNDDTSKKNKKKSLERFEECELIFTKLLGSGGFSNVFHARHSSTGRIFAVKKLKNALRNNPKLSAVCAADLAVETAVLANLNHDNIIKLHGICGDDNIIDLLRKGNFFICLDPLYETLDDKLIRWRNEAKKKGYMLNNQRLFRSQSRALKNNAEIVKRLEEIVMGIVNGMEYLHTNNIIYRDLKPGNIGFDEKTKQVKIFDFGLARIVSFDQEQREGGHLMTRKIGTPRYMAPEISRGENDYGFGVDVYSFSILLWQIVTDRIAFDGFYSSKELKQKVSMHNLRPPLQHVPKLLLKKIPEQETFEVDDKNSSKNNRNQHFDSVLLQEIIESGWSDSVENRPTFTTIRRHLQYITKTSLSKSENNMSRPLFERRRSVSGFFLRRSSNNVSSSKPGSGSPPMTTMKRRNSDPYN